MTIISRGSSPDGIFVIVEGKVHVRLEVGMSGGTSLSVQLNQLGPGNIFGEMSFIDHDDASADVIADGKVKVLRISTSAIETFKRTDYTFAGRFYRSLAKTLSRRLRAMNARLVLGLRHPIS